MFEESVLAGVQNSCYSLLETCAEHADDFHFERSIFSFLFRITG